AAARLDAYACTCAHQRRTTPALARTPAGAPCMAAAVAGAGGRGRHVGLAAADVRAPPAAVGTVADAGSGLAAGAGGRGACNADRRDVRRAAWNRPPARGRGYLRPAR